MAKIKGENLVISVHDGTIYRPIACLTSNSLSESRNVIESQTKCSPGVIERLAGTYSYELSFDGEKIDTTSAGAEATKASFDFMHDIIDAGTAVNWKLATGLTDVPFYYGNGVLSDNSGQDGAGDELATFSGSISGNGKIVKVDPV
jgi:hypothetical protein